MSSWRIWLTAITVVLSSLTRIAVHCDVCVCVNIIEDILSTAEHIRYTECASNWCGKIPNIISYIYRDTQPWNILFEVGEFSRRAKKKLYWNEQMNKNNRMNRTTERGSARTAENGKGKNGCHFMGIYLFIYFSFNNLPKNAIVWDWPWSVNAVPSISAWIIHVRWAFNVRAKIVRA